MAATLNVLSVHVVGFIFFAGYYAQFLSGLNTGHRYHSTQVLIPLKKHFKAICCHLTGRSLRYPICRWNKHGCVCLFLPANVPVPIDLTIAVDVESNPGPVWFRCGKITECRTTQSEANCSFMPNLAQRGKHYSQYANYPAQFVYSRSQLHSIRFSCGKIKPGDNILGKLKEFSLLKYRGNRAGHGSRSGLRIPTLAPQDRKNANYLRSSGRYRTLTVVDLADKPGPSAPKIVPKCMVINARSLAKPDAASALHAELHSNNIDICFVSETWLNNRIPSHLVCPNGYIL